MAIRYRCRNSKCYRRFSIPASASQRRKDNATCPRCKTPNARNIEAERRKEKQALQDRHNCRCGAYPFPHVKGEMVMCHFHPDRLAGLDPTPEDIVYYEDCLRTPRGNACC